MFRNCGGCQQDDVLLGLVLLDMCDFFFFKQFQNPMKRISPRFCFLPTKVGIGIRIIPIKFACVCIHRVI